LIISYYWPPAGGVGVQRWLKMTKYFSENGWQPIIYTALPENYIAEDQNLVNEIHKDCIVLKRKIWEPYKYYALLTGKKKGDSNYSGFITKKEKPSFTQKLSVFIRSNFFIPDARKFWINPSISHLHNWLKKNEVDAIVSTGPPHSMHMIAMGLKKKNPTIPWIADFRDPWTQIDHFQDLQLSKRSKEKHKRLEKEVLQKADKVVTVSWTWAKDLAQISGKSNVDVILNGYDTEDFKNFNSKPSEKFILCHLGSMPANRNPESFWKAVANLIHKNQKIKAKIEIHLIGPVDGKVFASIAKNKLEAYIKHKQFVPHHKAIQYLQKCNLLLLFINPHQNGLGRLPAKLYEYMATGKPILAIGPKKGDINKIITTLSNASLFEYQEENEIEKQITSIFTNRSTIVDDTSIYTREHLAKEYVKLLNDLN